MGVEYDIFSFFQFFFFFLDGNLLGSCEDADRSWACNVFIFSLLQSFPALQNIFANTKTEEHAMTSNLPCTPKYFVDTKTEENAMTSICVLNSKIFCGHKIDYTMTRKFLVTVMSVFTTLSPTLPTRSRPVSYVAKLIMEIRHPTPDMSGLNVAISLMVWPAQQ